MDTQLVKRQDNLALSSRGLELRSLADLRQFGDLVVKSQFAPKGMSATDVVIAIQYGMEVGLSPMQSLQNISVINGKPAVWGDAAIALVEASKLLESKDEQFVQEKGGLVAVCTVKRRGKPGPRVVRFSEAMAKRAGLWGKPGPWTSYPQRMLQMRARSWALRDEFADVLKGLYLVEEAQDIPPEPGPQIVKASDAFRPPQEEPEAKEATYEVWDEEQPTPEGEDPPPFDLPSEPESEPEPEPVKPKRGSAALKKLTDTILDCRDFEEELRRQSISFSAQNTEGMSLKAAEEYLAYLGKVYEKECLGSSEVK